MREIKKSSNVFINPNKFSKLKFEWQSEYGAFSQAYREEDIVIKYIQNQERHHTKNDFRTEYLDFLKSYNIDFKNEYVFEFL